MTDFLESHVSVPMPVVIVAGLVFLLLVVVIWSIRRNRAPSLEIDSKEPIGKLLPSLSGLAQSAVYLGNDLQIFENGKFFDALLEEIASAKSTVHFETFLWKKGTLGQRLANALAERQRAGIQVRVLVDANGGRTMGEDVVRQLKEAGCKFATHHPRHWYNVGVVNDRDHRKIAVIDGRVAFVGGHCIVDEWLGNAQDRKHVRDLSVRVRGPVVHAIQGTFSENWVENTGELLVGAECFPELERQGTTEIHLASLKPEGSAPAVKILHHLAICVARKRIRIQNPYFVPDQEAIAAFGAAVDRGVDVRVMVPSAAASDMPVVQHAAHHNFERLLASSVRIFEYDTCLLHQKVMVIDGVWSAIGSTNFDDRSFETNDEITLSIRDDAFAAKLEEIFEHDCERCTELTLETWRKRGLLHRLQDRALYAFNELL
jgi:cardiolipin synthase